jgi:hypothetical protein
MALKLPDQKGGEFRRAYNFYLKRLKMRLERSVATAVYKAEAGPVGQAAQQGFDGQVGVVLA